MTQRSRDVRYRARRTAKLQRMETELQWIAGQLEGKTCNLAVAIRRAALRGLGRQETGDE